MTGPHLTPEREERPVTAYFHVRKTDLCRDSALVANPPFESFDVVLRRDYDALMERAERAVERVARALYERAMSERRTFSRTPQKFSKRWDDPPHDDLSAQSRLGSWRDAWRDDARAALTSRIAR